MVVLERRQMVSGFKRGTIAGRSTEIDDPLRDHTMGTRDARVDAYIAKSADFAKPILTHLRDFVHATCPEVEETMKWSFPNFMYKGMLCSHGLVQGALLFRLLERLAHCPQRQWQALKKEWAISDASPRISDLPSKKILTGYIKKAMKLNEDGVKKSSPAQTEDTRESLLFPTIWRKPFRETRRPGPLSRNSVPATNASISTGSPRPRPKPPARNGCKQQSNGWPKARRGTGNI